MEYLAHFQSKPNLTHPLRVWLVDDDVDLCDAYVDYFRDLFQVSEVFHCSLPALTALQNAAHKIPDVIVVDRNMTDLDGLSLSKEIVKLNLPLGILMVSGGEYVLSEDESEALNIFGSIQKPASPAVIHDAIKAFGSFMMICHQIEVEVLRLCRKSSGDWEFFLGMHADLDKAFKMPSHRKLCLTAAIREIESRLRQQKIVIPADSRLADLFQQFGRLLRSN